MRRTGAVILTIFMSIAGLNMLAQNGKVGHINSQEIIQAMPEYDSAMVKYEKVRKELQTHLGALSTEFNAKYDAYLKESKKLNAVVKQAREQELYDMERRIQEFQATAEDQLQAKQVELFQPVYEKAEKAIQAVGTENEFLYIFDTQQGGVLLYFDESKSINITALAKAKLNIK